MSKTQLLTPWKRCPAPGTRRAGISGGCFKRTPTPRVTANSCPHSSSSSRFSLVQLLLPLRLDPHHQQPPHLSRMLLSSVSPARIVSTISQSPLRVLFRWVLEASDGESRLSSCSCDACQQQNSTYIQTSLSPLCFFRETTAPFGFFFHLWDTTSIQTRVQVVASLLLACIRPTIMATRVHRTQLDV